MKHLFAKLDGKSLCAFAQKAGGFCAKDGQALRKKAGAFSNRMPGYFHSAPENSRKTDDFSFFLPTFELQLQQLSKKRLIDMENRSLVTIAKHSKEKILYLLEMAKEFEKKPNRRLLDGKIVATLFFEPSTRTRLSFETAANRLGAKVIGFTDPKVTSSSKGETLKDTIMMVSNYADIIVMRHFLEGAARYASEVAPVPIVNAGDGANQHPSQTMLDLYSIYKTQGTLENLNIYLVGDLKYGRTVHSLLMAMRHFNPTFHFVAPDELRMPDEYKLYCKEHGIRFEEHTDFTEETIADADILYMTRVQRERFTDLMEYERVKDVYILRNKMLERTRPNLRILHPLPRVNEIAYDVDDNPKAYYFQQAKNGLYAREAILCDVLGITLDEVKADTETISRR